MGLLGQTSSDVLRHPPSSHAGFELLEPVFQQHLSIGKFLHCSILGERFESPHMKSCWFLKVFVSFRENREHYYPYDKGREPDNSSRLLSFLTDVFDHVDDILNPSVYLSIGCNGVYCL